MIESIHLKNFQSHVDTKIDFDSGVNVIVGNSDSGKTAIIRALNWAINNKPSGDAFIHYGTGGVEVEVLFNQSTEPNNYTPIQITRRKSKTKNEYVMQTLDGVIGEFRALGQGVPQEIEELLNIKDINIQRQMDAPFLLSMTPGQAGQYLNEVVDLTAIDNSLKNINQKVKVNRHGIESLQSDMRECSFKIQEYDYLEPFKSSLDDIGDLIDEIDKLQKELDDIQRLLDEHERLNIISQQYKNIPSTQEKVNCIEKMIAEKELIEKEYHLLSKIHSTYVDNRHVFDSLPPTIVRIENELKTLQPNICSKCGQEIPL